MTLNNLNYLFPVVVFLAIFFFLYFRNRRNFFQWVEDHWFFKQSLLNKFSTYLYFAGIVLVVLAMLDLRGAEKRIKGASLDQKTIILIDSSASMLAEDVRPNRFKKALLLVKHYVKKAVGQQISIVVFSDSQKRIIPFTDDIDLIYARIERLNELNLGRGGTGLSQAIAESVEYFKSSGGELSGNILIFSDAEETELGFPLKIPSEITVGMIGIGTAKGAPIPERDSRGEFKGNKKFQGKVVISKLNEEMLKSLSNKIEHYRYWIATSYSLPTEEILSFFNRVSRVKNNENEFRVRPVMANYLLVPGSIFLILAFLLNFRKSFSLVMLIFMTTITMAQQPEGGEPKEPVKSENTLKLESLLSKNQLGDKGKKKLAESLLQDGFPALAETLYEEVLPKKINPSELRDFSNYALSKIQNGKKVEGLEDSKEMLEYLEKNNVDQSGEIVKNLEKNILKAIEEGGGGGKGKSQSKDKNKDKKEKSDKDKSGGDGDKDPQDPKDNEDQENKDKEGDKEDQKKNDSGKEKDDKKDKPQESEGDKEEMKKKLPALLKQLISDDNQLQKKIIDAKTTERKTREQKDW